LSTTIMSFDQPELNETARTWSMTGRTEAASLYTQMMMDKVGTEEP
jgi:hypothetical protein